MQAVALCLFVAFAAGQSGAAVDEPLVETPGAEQTPADPPPAAEQPPASLEEPPPTDPPPHSEQPPASVDEKPKETFRAPPANLYLKKPGPGRRVSRIGVELMMSTLGELTGGLAGSMVGCATVEYGPQGCLIGFLAGALIGALVGVPAGVIIGGYIMDGNGSVPATIAGALAGIGLSAVLIGAVTYNLNGSSALAILSGVGFLLMPNLISILAFELTSDTSRRYEEATTPLKISLAPTVTTNGAGAALAMTF